MQKYSLKIAIPLLLALFSNTLINGSDIVSISSFTKEKKKVYVFGLNLFIENNINSPALTSYKKFLDTLRSNPFQTIYMLNSAKEIIANKVTEKNSTLSTILCGLTENHAYSCNFQSGALVYRAYPDIVAQFQYRNSSIFACFMPVNIEAFAKKNPSLEKWLLSEVLPYLAKTSLGDPFFNNPENIKKFASLKKIILTTANGIYSWHSIEDYLTILEAYSEKFKDLPNTPLFLPLKNEWENVKERACCYLNEYSSHKKSKLAEVYVSLIEKNKSYMAGLDAMTKVVTPLHLIEKLECYLLLMQSLADCDNTIVQLSCLHTKGLIEGFKKMGFATTTLGFIPDGPEMLSIGRSFSDSEIDAHFTSLVHDTFSSQNTTQKNTTSCSFYDEQSQKFLPTSLKDRTEQSCSCCHLTVQTCEAFATTSMTVYCSLMCLITTFLNQETTTLPLSVLLDEKHLLSVDETLMLKQFGVLCYLQAALLMPSLPHEEGIIYQLPLGKIISCLEKIITCPDANKSVTWKYTLALCLLWKIDLGYIKTFLNTYKNAKDTYLKALLKNSTSCDNSWNTTDNTFSESKIIGIIGNQLTEKLKKEFTFSSGTDSNSLLFIYRELVKRIHKRVGLPFDRVEDLLTMTYKQDDLETILAYLGYEKNPLKFSTKRSKKSPENHSFREEESSSSEEISSKSHEGSLTEYTTSSSSTTSGSSTSTPEYGFRQTSSSRKKRIHTIRAYYGGCKSYTISLFKTGTYIPEELQDIHAIWNACNGTKESKRIQLIFALAYQAQEQGCSLYTNSYGLPAFAYNDQNYDASLREKLDLGHLFTRTVDAFLHLYGIAERIDNLIQVSIPGEIAYDGIKKVGFFQYSFTPEWVCIHRCFKSYDVTSTDTYVSKALKTVLYKFLVNEYSLDDSYASIIKQLEKSLGYV